MKTTVDYAADCAYIGISSLPTFQTRRHSNTINVDYSADSQVVGIEFLRIPTAQDLQDVQSILGLAKDKLLPFSLPVFITATTSSIESGNARARRIAGVSATHGALATTA